MMPYSSDSCNVSPAASCLRKAGHEHTVAASVLPLAEVTGLSPAARSSEQRGGASATAFPQRRGSAGWSSHHQLTLFAITDTLAGDEAQDTVCSLKISLLICSRAHSRPSTHTHTHSHAHPLFSQEKTRKTAHQGNNSSSPTHPCLTFVFVSPGGFSVVAEHLAAQILTFVSSYCPRWTWPSDTALSYHYRRSGKKCPLSLCFLFQSYSCQQGLIQLPLQTLTKTEPEPFQAFSA